MSKLFRFISHGGEATNIIPDRAVVQAELRAYDLEIWRDMKQKVLRCFEAGAVATGCTWEWEATEYPYAPLVHEEVLAELWDKNLTVQGRSIDSEARLGGGSTDMGNVSQVVPSIHPLLTFRGKQAPAHNPAFTEIAASAEADEAIIDGAVTTPPSSAATQRTHPDLKENRPVPSRRDHNHRSSRRTTARAEHRFS